MKRSSYLASAKSVAAITPSDTVLLPFSANCIYVGGTGDISILCTDGTSAIFRSVPVGTQLWVEAARVNLTNTTATNLVAYR